MLVITSLLFSACALLVPRFVPAVLPQPDGPLLAQNDSPAEPQTEAADGPVEASKPAADDSTSPQAVFKTARDRLISYRSIKARLVETVAFDDRKFKATGTYLQGTNLRLRLEFNVQVGSSEGSILQVCDGQVLWTRQRIGPRPKGQNGKPQNDPGNVTITRRNVRQILDAAAEAGSHLKKNILIAELGLGGLPALLASLEQTMTFETTTSEEINDARFTVVEGTWSDEFLKGMVPDTEDWDGQLPAHIPERVKVYFDDRSFPRRIMYLKKVPDRNFSRPMVTLDLNDVVLDGPVDQREFNYSPPERVYTEDVTNRYIQRLKASSLSN